MSTQINPPVYDIGELLEKNKRQLSEIEGLISGNEEEKQSFEAFKRTFSDMEVANDINRNIVTDMLSLLYPMEDTPNISYSDNFPYIDNDTRRPNYKTLRLLSRSEPSQIILNWAWYNLKDYCRPACQPIGQHSTQTPDKGFRFTFEDRVPTKQERMMLDDLERRICRHFFFPFGETVPDMHGFIAQSYYDHFVLDDISIEKARDLTATPIGLHIRDPQYYSPIVPKNPVYPRWDVVGADEYNRLLKDPSKLHFITDEYLDERGDEYEYLFFDRTKNRHGKLTRFQFEKIHFFRTSETRYAKRGYSILEQAMNTVKAILQALTFNAANISNNHAPQGIISITGGTSNLIQLEKFKKLIWAHTSGAAEKFKIPIIGLPKDGDLKWTPINYASKDLEFHLWMVFLFTVLCRFAGISPEIISIGSYEASMSNNTLFKQDAEAIRQISTNDGLKSFLEHIADRLNKMNLWNYILPGAKIICQFVGLESEVQQTKLELDTKRVSLYSSVNDIRKEKGLPPSELMINGRNVYNIPGYLNPTISQTVMQEMQVAAQAAMANQQQQQSPQGNEMAPEDQALIEKYGEPESKEKPGNE